MSLVPAMPRQSLLVAATVLLAVGLPAQVVKLENPQRSVFSSFPDADSYQVIRRDVDVRARKQIEARLPFRVHFDEIGLHSHYVALRGRRPVGMIYAQREETMFGMATVEWAFTTDLRVSGFRFQYVRSKHRGALENSAFVRKLKGKSLDELVALLDAEGQLLRTADGVSTAAQGLAASVVRSGAKSLAVLDVVWGIEIQKLHDKAVGMSGFPEARAFRRAWPPKAGQSAQRTAESDVLLAVHAYGRRAKYLGCVFDVRMRVRDPVPSKKARESDPKRRERQVGVRWIVDAKGLLVETRVPPTAPRAFRAACNELEGLRIADLARDGGTIASALKSAWQFLKPVSKPDR